MDLLSPLLAITPQRASIIHNRNVSRSSMIP
jgi:hypothetical protein